MILKPKNSVNNVKALLYRRFTNIESSATLNVIYMTISNGIYWLFNSEELKFYKFTQEIPQTAIIKQIQDISTVLQYQGKYFRYTGLEWEQVETASGDITLLNATFNNISKYQTNKYYFVGSFDYIITGSISGSTTQSIMGNIIPLTSMNIKHYNDSINLSQDDLIVIDKHLYSVENPEVDHKHLPRDYKVYFATLNSIL